MMTQNLFFQRNTIKEFAYQHPPEIRTRSKRSASVATLKMNPSKFQHRQVFDNRIYDKISYLKLDIDQLKEKEQQKGFTPSKELNRTINSLAEILQEQSIMQVMNNFNNHCTLMHKSDVKKEFIDTITQIITSLLRKIQGKVEEAATNKKQLEAKVAEYEATIRAIKRQSLTSLDQSRKTSRKAERQKELRELNNQLDFNLKKEMLKVDQLEEQLREQTKLNNSLTEQINAMRAERDAQASYRESMEYKVKRLKEQLEVAHIIKEQNLADKMKYIMNW